MNKNMFKVKNIYKGSDFMPYKEMKTPAKEKDNKPKKPEIIDDSEIQKHKRKSAMKFEQE